MGRLNTSFKRITILLGAVSLLPVTILLWFCYAYVMPHHVDRDLFRLVGEKYDSGKVIYRHALGSEVGVAYVQLTPKRAAEILNGPAATFDICTSRFVDHVECVPDWVSTSDYTPNDYISTPGNQHERLHDRVVAKSASCSYAIYSDRGFASVEDMVYVEGSGGPAVYDYICANPDNGVVMYMRIRV